MFKVLQSTVVVIASTIVKVNIYSVNLILISCVNKNMHHNLQISDSYLKLSFHYSKVLLLIDYAGYYSPLYFQRSGNTFPLISFNDNLYMKSLMKS